MLIPTVTEIRRHGQPIVRVRAGLAQPAGSTSPLADLHASVVRSAD